MGGALAIHYAGQVTQPKKNANYQKADDSWIDHEPNRVAHAEASAAIAQSDPCYAGGRHTDAAVPAGGAELCAFCNAKSCR